MYIGCKYKPMVSLFQEGDLERNIKLKQTSCTANKHGSMSVAKNPYMHTANTNVLFNILCYSPTHILETKLIIATYVLSLSHLKKLQGSVSNSFWNMLFKIFFFQQRLNTYWGWASVSPTVVGGAAENMYVMSITNLCFLAMQNPRLILFY